jgi:hypothetical protein
VLAPSRVFGETIELVEKAKPLFPGSGGCPDTKACLRVKLREGHGRELFDELVHAQVAALRQVPEPCVLLVGESNRMPFPAALGRRRFAHFRSWQIGPGVVAVGGPGPAMSFEATRQLGT